MLSIARACSKSQELAKQVAAFATSAMDERGMAQGCAIGANLATYLQQALEILNRLLGDKPAYHWSNQ